MLDHKEKRSLGPCLFLRPQDMGVCPSAAHKFLAHASVRLCTLAAHGWRYNRAALAPLVNAVLKRWLNKNIPSLLRWAHPAFGSSFCKEKSIPMHQAKLTICFSSLDRLQSARKANWVQWVSTVTT